MSDLDSLKSMAETTFSTIKTDLKGTEAELWQPSIIFVHRNESRHRDQKIPKRKGKVFRRAKKRGNQMIFDL